MQITTHDSRDAAPQSSTDDPQKEVRYQRADVSPLGQTRGNPMAFRLEA